MALGTVPETTDPATGTPLAKSIGDPAVESKPWYAQVIESLTGKPLGQGGGGAAITGLGNLVEGINRWQMQQRLADPRQVLKQSQILSGGLSKALKRDVAAATGQEMAQAGLAGAPGLYSQAVASALAPIRARQQEMALQEYLSAMNEAGGMYGGYGQYPGQSEAGQ